MRKAWLVIGSMLLSCGDEGGSGSNEIDRYAQKLRECELISKGGKYASLPSEELDPTAVCLLNCTINASCSELEKAWCDGTPPASLTACADACLRVVACKDGSSDEAYRCDGYFDCDDDSDEEGCSPELYLFCADGERFPKDYKCDGEEDCSDASDEKNCPASALFTCKNGEKIIKEFECDGEEDCSDASDEQGCVARGLVFECKSGEGTVASYEVCDLFPDCDDGSDEEQGCAELLCEPPPDDDAF